MFGIFLFAVLFVGLCMFTAEPTPQAAIAPVPPVDERPSLADLLAEAEALIAKPLPPRTAALVAQAAAIAAPVAIARIEDAWIAELEVEPPSATADYLTTWTTPQLRKECGRRGIAWRNAHGKGKHLLKGEMVKALS